MDKDRLVPDIDVDTVIIHPLLLITITDGGWIGLYERGKRWVIVPPDIPHPYGPDLPTPQYPQNQIIGKWLMRKPGWDK